MKYFYTYIKFLCLLFVLSFSFAGDGKGMAHLSGGREINRGVVKEKPIPTLSGYGDIIKTYGDSSFELVDPVSNSAGAFSYHITDGSVAEVDGKQVSINGAGITALVITQAETELYKSATVTVHIVVHKAEAIMELKVDGVVYGEDDIVEASYGDIRMFMIASNSDASFYDYEFDLLDDYLDPYIDFSNFPFISAIKVGTTSLEIRIPGTRNYLGVTQRLTLRIKRKEIFINPISGQFKRYGDADEILAFTSSEPLIGGDSFFGELSRQTGEVPGFYAIELGTLEAGDNYDVMLGEGEHQYEIKKGLQAINFSLPNVFNLNDANHVLNAVSDRGLPITFSSSNSNIAQVYQDAMDSNQWKLKMIGEGTARITASQTGNSLYEPASLFYDINVVSGTLPIELASFTAMVRDGSALIQWTSLSETQNKAFQLYRSVDGKNYEMLAEIKGAGNSGTPTNYQYRDIQPVNGVNYYQLFQMDVNGTLNSLGIRDLKFNLVGNNISVYPNPTTDWVELDFKGKAFTQLSVFDMSGKQLFQQKLNPSEASKQVSFKEFTTGIYLIKLQGKASVGIIRVIKK